MTEPTEFESSPDAYRVKLDRFEGPLDLLLYLIRKSEVNIYDIPVADITEQYLAYITLMEELNLDVAGEFLVMAATLIHIKSKMLLPRPETAQDSFLEEEDPRDELVRRLIEHQKFKQAADALHDRETARSAQFTRPDSRVADAVSDDYEPELEVDLFSLLAAFKGVLDPCQPAVADGAAAGADFHRGPDPSAARPALGNAGLRLRGPVRGRRRVTTVHDRDVSGAARDDPVEADSRVPVGRLWCDSRLQTGATRGCAAPDRRPAGSIES